MIENLYTNRGDQVVTLYFSSNGLSQERNDYLAYKTNSFTSVSQDKLLEFRVLNLLESLGMSTNDVGTYLYANVVVKIVNELSANKGDELYIQNLMSELERPYSQFYVDIARHELDMGVKTFHSHISAALMKVNRNKNKLGKMLKRLDFGDQVFVLADYVYSEFGCIENIDKPFIRKKNLVSKINQSLIN